MSNAAGLTYVPQQATTSLLPRPALYPEGVNKRALVFTMGLLLAITIGYTSTLSTHHKHALHTQGVLHPWLHFGGFALVSFLLISATRSQVLRVLLFGLLLFFGWATEAHESGRNGWPIEVKDVHTDAIGVGLGFVLALIASPSRLPKSLPVAGRT